MKKSNYFRHLLLIAGLAAGVPAALSQSTEPDILRPDPINGALLYGLSDSGDWGVSCVSPGYEGFSDFMGASVYDLRTNPVQSQDLAGGEMFCSGFDITDDGLTVAGSYRQLPAICRNEDGVWNWYSLPVPDREIQVYNQFTEQYVTYRLNGGEALNITPDGRYAVGLATSIEYINLEVACMWDLQTMELMELPGLGLENSTFSRLTQISADGRYVVGRGGGYFVYDRETGTRRSARVGLDIYAQGMSTNGRYLSGVINRGDVPYASFWDMETNELTVLDEPIYADAVAWTVTNDGVPLIARPYLTPYADAYVYYDGFMYSFDEILSQAYGIDMEAIGIDNTGKPYKVSADGRTMVCITAIGDCYVLRLKEDIGDAVAKVDLFKDWKAEPADGARMTTVGKVTLTFTHPIQIPEGKTPNITLLGPDGKVAARPVANGGIRAEGNSLVLSFGYFKMTPGERYTVKVPAGSIEFQGRSAIANSELRVAYEGRENVPVKPVGFFPLQGAPVSYFSLADNPVAVTFDEFIKVNVPADGERPVAKVYIDGLQDLVGFANMDVDLNTGDRLVLFPDNPIPFYRGSNYFIAVPAGAVTDLSGTGASEEFVVEYEGSLVPQLGDDKYLFRSDCSSYDPFLFYEGDHGYPTYEYREMGFTQDNTPWAVVCDENSTDMAFGSHSSYNPLVKADDWVATRQILIPDGARAYLAFDSQSHRKARTDYLKVIVYENVSLINSLNDRVIEDIRSNGKLVYSELQSPGATEDNLSGEWTHNVVDLSEFSGKSIYICFLNDNYNGSLVAIDNIEVVNDVSAFITLRNSTNVVDCADIRIWGMVSVTSPDARYSKISMTLRDASGAAVSSISEDGLDLGEGDYYAFEFPEALPLEAGVENPFTIEYALDSEEMDYSGVVRNLVFEPETRAVIEEFTGRACQYCPGGIVTMEHLKEVYGDRVLPVALHCYMGTDPKGLNVMDYWTFTGMGMAPQARVNRGPASSPILDTPSGYVNSGVDGEKLWKDYVAEALGTPALVDVEVDCVSATPSELKFEARFRSALSMENVSYRVFGVLVEDGLADRQANAYYTVTDPLMGEWGAGGIYGKATAEYVFDDVAREVWGTSYNGTPGLLPALWSPQETYSVEMAVKVPSIVKDTDNCRLVVMLIDETTGRVVNSARSSYATSGVSAAPGSGSGVTVESAPGGCIAVTSPGECVVDVFDTSGRRIASAAGSGSFTVSLGGFRGLALVRSVAGDACSAHKILVK